MTYKAILIAILAAFAFPCFAQAQASSVATFQIVTDTLEEEQNVQLHIAIADPNITTVQVEVTVQPEAKILIDQTLQLDDLEAESLESISYDGAMLRLNFGTHPIKEYQAVITRISANGTQFTPITIQGN